MKTLTLKAGGATFHIRRNGSGWAARSPISEEHGCGHGEAARRSTRRRTVEPPPFSDLLRSFAE